MVQFWMLSPAMAHKSAVIQGVSSKAHPMHKQYQPKPGFMNINSNGIIIIKIAQAKPILVT
jgi:hypothetical protein